MSTITVSPMALEYVLALEPKKDLFYVVRDGRLIPARLDAPITGANRKLLSTPGGVPKGRFVPTVTVQSIYGSIFVVAADQFFMDDPDGEKAYLIDTVGTQVSFAIYAPGMEGEDVQERIRKALREEFGAGVLHLRQMSHQLVSEAGLPPVLGAPEGQLTRLI